MGGSEGDQTNLVGMIEHQDVLTPPPVLVQTDQSQLSIYNVSTNQNSSPVQLCVVSLSHCLVILRLDGGNAVLNGWYLPSLSRDLTHHLELLKIKMILKVYLNMSQYKIVLTT